MAASEPGQRRPFALLAVIFLAFTGIFWPLLDDEAPLSARTETVHSSVKIVTWNWKKNRTGTVFAIYGQVRNLTDSPIKQIVLELRTVDGEGREIARHPITIADIPAGRTKPFREDLPRTGKEARGFLEIRQVIP